MVDDNGGRRWWRMTKDEDSQPWCINIAEMEHFWLRGWRPEYPLQAQPLAVEDAGLPVDVRQFLTKLATEEKSKALHMIKQWDFEEDGTLLAISEKALAWLAQQEAQDGKQ